MFPKIGTFFKKVNGKSSLFWNYFIFNLALIVMYLDPTRLLSLCRSENHTWHLQLTWLLLDPRCVLMLLENRAPGDASTSDGPSSRTSCALRGLRWPGTPALLIRMVWLMEERWRKRWVWKRYRGRENGWVGGLSKALTLQLLHLPLRPEWGSLRDCETEGCGSPRQPGIMELKGWTINLTAVVSFDYHIAVLHLILYLIRVFQSILMEPECIN